MRLESKKRTSLALIQIVFYNLPLTPVLAVIGSPMLMDPANSRSHHTVFQLQKGRKYLGVCLLIWAKRSGIQTRIVGVEGQHADHLTTTPAQGHASKLLFHILPILSQMM